MTTTLFLTSDDVDGLATPAEFVDAVREGYRQRGHTAPTEPRTTVATDDPPGRLTGYMGILPETGVMGGYVYASGFSNQDAWFVTPLFDATTGEPLAIIDGASINPFKTGAAGAVAVDSLAQRDATTAAVIGSGAQARGQLRATATVRDLQLVRVFSPTEAHRERFADELSSTLGIEIRAVESPAEAIADAQIVITATRSDEPVFDGSNLPSGAHVTAMGQYHPEKRELDATTIERSIYVPDLAGRVMTEAGSFIAAVDEGGIDESHVHAELGDVVAGRAPGRTNPDDITVFDSGGTAIETVAAAHLVYERAVEGDIGTWIDFAPASEALTGR